MKHLLGFFQLGNEDLIEIVYKFVGTLIVEFHLQSIILIILMELILRYMVKVI